MQFVLLFLEGIVTFISPCLLPMLPIYVSYFIGGYGSYGSSGIGTGTGTGSGVTSDGTGGAGKANALKNSLGFVLGFTLVFIALGAFSGSIGRALQQHGTAVNIVTGLVVIVFGLNYLGVLRIPLLNRASRRDVKVKDLGFWSSVSFGLVFSIGWTPCVGAFLGSALMMASRQGSVIQGSLLLLAFSLGLGIPFVVSAVLIDKLKGAFDFVKKHYKIINIISGGFLVLVGVLMMTGAFGYFLSLLTF